MFLDERMPTCMDAVTLFLTNDGDLLCCGSNIRGHLGMMCDCVAITESGSLVA
jgi:alpha-tubulin suppressor-like RCC1 family protein